MWNKFLSFLTENIIWKATALILAAILWVIAINIEDPMETRQFFPVRVGFENIDTLNRLGLVILNQEEIERSFVNASIWANRRSLNQLEAADLRAYVDLGSEIFEHVGRVGEVIHARVHLRLPEVAADNVILHNTTPHTLTLLLDTLDTREFPVTVVKNSNPIAGFVSMEPVVTPATVQISGPSTVLDTIMNVRAGVNLDRVHADYYIYSDLEVFNENNINISDRVTVNPEAVEIFVPINRIAQVQVTMPALYGSLSDGLAITNMQFEPAYIDIVGRAEDLADFAGITFDPINISGLTAGVNAIHIDVRDYLRTTPLSVQNGRPHEVIVSLTVEVEEVLEIVVRADNIQVIGEPAAGYTAGLNEDLVIRVIGVGRLVQGMNQHDIGVAVNISGLEEGVHNVPVALTLPERIRPADGEVHLSVNITALEGLDNYTPSQNNYNEPEDDEENIEIVPPTF